MEKPEESKPINYRKSSVETRSAYFKWKKLCHLEKHHVISFVAGYNAATNDSKNKEREG